MKKTRRVCVCTGCQREVMHFARGLCVCCWRKFMLKTQKWHHKPYEPSTIHRVRKTVPRVRIAGEEVSVQEAPRNGVLLRLCNIDLEAERLERLRRVELYRERAGRGEPLGVV